ncbi:hypothetical protein KY084_00795 [Stakelama sp. CBK3Z-3]|uniref:Uncharacterized protein n=2 Tax=Stakelama flava TaxID=2860338 RepID=A0ABS6XIX7_9SPHN|nr:hypothetical protein [Stakelama flava]
MKRAVQALPHVQPDHAPARLLLFAMRRMGANGLHDAVAAHALFTTFGPGFRRPLTLLRTLMAEISSSSTGSIRIAPPCCCRMTADESAMVECVARITTRPDRSALIAADLVGRRDPGGILIAAAALATAFEDLGAPLYRD